MFWFSAKKTAVGRKCFLTESCQGTDIKGTDPLQIGGLPPSFLPGASDESILSPEGNFGFFFCLHSENTGFRVSKEPQLQGQGRSSVWVEFFTSPAAGKVF